MKNHPKSDTLTPKVTTHPKNHDIPVNVIISASNRIILAMSIAFFKWRPSLIFLNTLRQTHKHVKEEQYSASAESVIMPTIFYSDSCRGKE